MSNHDLTLLRHLLAPTAVIATPAACLSGDSGAGKDTGDSQVAGSGQPGVSGDGGGSGSSVGSGTGPITLGWIQAEFAENLDERLCEASWQFTGPVAGVLEWSVDLRLVDIACERGVEFF